jgi:hypothetical protein
MMKMTTMGGLQPTEQGTRVPLVYMIAQNVRPLAKCEKIGIMPLRRMYFKVAALHMVCIKD